jgi:hypothetical protein
VLYPGTICLPSIGIRGNDISVQCPGDFDTLSILEVDKKKLIFTFVT